MLFKIAGKCGQKSTIIFSMGYIKLNSKNRSWYRISWKRWAKYYKHWKYLFLYHVNWKLWHFL